MIKSKFINIAAILLSVLFFTTFTGCSGNSDNTNPNNVTLDPKNPVTVTVWHYYNGAQQEAFNQLVAEFNDTYGKDNGIIVESFSQGNTTDLENNVLASVNKKVGAAALPSIFAAYADTAYTVDKLGYVVDLLPYFTEDELDKFIDSYIDEGRFTPESGLKIFPVAKSPELFMLNKTDWDKFASATGAQLSDISTIEGITETAKKYYEWTDSLTPDIPEDGKAFFGRDAFANYFIIGALQNGMEITSVSVRASGSDGKTVLTFNKDIVKKIWDNYYVPYINGYFASSGRFRSDDIKTGNIVAFVGSSSGATFFPSEVILSDTESYPIEMAVMEAPQFENGQNYAVQQGAGMVVTETNPKEIYASVQFLKWFTSDERNIRFSAASGYLPVTKSANNTEKILANIENSQSTTSEIISAAVNTVNNNTLYTPKAFENGTKTRNILEYSMSDLASADRASVIEKINSGMTREEAVSEFTSNEYFEKWYEKTLSELQDLIK